MIHSTRPRVSPVVIIVFAWNLFCFEKWERTDGHVQKQWSKIIFYAINIPHDVYDALW